MGRRIVIVLLLILSSTFSFAEKQWILVRSAHFSVLTDTGEKQGKEVALRFEQMRTIFGNLFFRSTVNMPVPLEIIAFRNQGEFRKYAPLWKGKPVELAGFFQGADDRNFIALDMSSPHPYETVFHEYAHLLLQGNFPVTPPWFDEGFAEYFSSLRIDGKTVEYGNVPSNLPEILQSNRWMPILDLLGTQHNSATYNERDKNTLFYAQSWITVHYIMSNNRLQQAARYLQLTQIEHRPIADSFQQAFGMDPAVFEKSVHDYFNGTGKYFRAPLPEFDPGPFRSEKVDSLTAQAMLADLQAHSKDYTQLADTEFQAVLEKDPRNEVATRGLGYLYLRKNEFDKAARMFERASLAGSKDPRLYYLDALLINRMAIQNGTAPKNPEIMRVDLETAIQLDPTMADAYNLLAFALSAQGKYDQAAAAEKKAIELNPSFEPYQSNLANVYMQGQKWDAAQAILARLVNSSHPEIRDNAKKMLASLEAYRETAAQMIRDRELRHDNITAPQWQKKNDHFVPPSDMDKEQVTPDLRKILYLTGELEAVDCSAEPVAVLTIRQGNRTLKMRTANYRKLIVMGADQFSCDWRNKRVLVNYKPGGETDGDLVTLELQAGK